MAKPAPAPTPNDGGIIVALVLLVAALCVVFFGAVALYASADIVLTTEQKQKTVRARRLARLLSGWANVGNAVAHALLIVMLVTDAERYKTFFPDEAAMPVGPAILGVLSARPPRTARCPRAPPESSGARGARYAYQSEKYRRRRAGEPAGESAARRYAGTGALRRV